MKRYIAIACLALAGCKPAMTNDQIIAETKKCEAAGMDARLYGRELDMQVTDVKCWPRKNP